MNPHDVKAAIQETLRGNTHITVTAPTGGGKSYFVGLLLEQAYAARKPWIVLDTSDRNHIGLIQLKGVTPLKIRKTENPDYSQLLTRPFILCYPDDEMEIDDLIEEYRKIIQALPGRPMQPLWSRCWPVPVRRWRSLRNFPLYGGHKCSARCILRSKSS